MSLFFHQLFANRIGAVFWHGRIRFRGGTRGFHAKESSRLRIAGRWLPILALLLVGVSLAFPMFLYMRERNLEQAEPAIKY